MKGGPYAFSKYLKGGRSHVGVSLLSQITSNRMRGVAPVEILN